MKRTYAMKGKLYKWQGAETGAWYFISVGKKESAEIKLRQKLHRGFGSIKVRARIGKTSWETSIFPTKEGPYLLPVKASVRTAEDLVDGDVVAYTVTLQ